ncbi:WGR domain protein, partial [Teladorsagia circumcincta]
FVRTPLHYAFASRSQFTKNALTSELRDPIAVVSILTRNMNKQQLDWGDCEGNSALHLAAFKNANICAVTLIRKGASVSVKNKVFPPKPIEVEENVWKWKGVATTVEKIAVSTIPAQVVAKGGGWEAMVYVLLDALGTARAGKDFASLRPAQPTQGPLRNAVLRLSERCDAESDVVLRELASLPHFRAAGADVNATDLEGRTPLMVAVLANKEAAIEALCGDGSMVIKKVVPQKKTAGHTATRLFLGAMQGRKRKEPENGNDEEDERAETEEESEAGSEQPESESAAEDEDEAEQDDTEETPPKKIRICNRNLDLMICDRKGRNFLHYMVEPIPWENVELLKKLYKESPPKIKQLLQQKNKDGNTPLDIAVRTKQRRMASAIKDILGGLAKGSKAKSSNGVQVSDLPDVSDLVCKYNVNEESKLFLARWHAEHDVADASAIPKPSALSGYRETAELVICPVTQQYMTAVLNKTDLNYGRYGFHNFYRIELMKRRDTDLWILFTNWGRIGMGRGEYQTTPFSTLDAAMKEFKSVWRSKTGQDWGPLSQFQVLPKKYRLVETTKKVNNLSEISLHFVENKEESLIRRSIQDISNLQKLKCYAKEMDRSMACPFGHISEAAIERARAILDECEKNVDELEKVLAKENHSDADVLKVFETSRTLSGEFYNTFPIADFEYGTVKIFDLKDDINRARETLNRMAEVEVATRLLTGAAYRKDVDRIRFLWHGTKAVNLMSILKDGFLVDPHNTTITGRLFGDGIYLADSFEKSSHYCQPSANGLNYMLLCR